MAGHRKTTIPHPELVEQYLERESNLVIRLRLTLLHLMIKLDPHLPFDEVCDLLKVPASTAYTWIRSWKESGYAGLVNPAQTTGQPPGRPPSLTDIDVSCLKAMLAGRPHWETREVRELIARHFGVTLSPSQVWRILKHKLHLSFSKLYPRDYRRPADAEAQLEDALITAYDDLLDRGFEFDRIALGFLDEASPQTTANTARVWHIGHPPIIKNTSRYKANAIGFYAIVGHGTHAFLPDSKQASVRDFLVKVREAHPDGEAIIVVLDRFPSHRAITVRDWARAHDIELVFLPRYSPDLNPIEFIWKTIKREVSLKFIHSLFDLQQIITTVWEASAKKCSYAKYWIDRFIPSIYTYKQLCD